MNVKGIVTGPGGTDYYVGEWDVVETAKTVTFTLTKPPLGLGRNWTDATKVLVCRKDGRGRHAVRIWGDGAYTVYPDRNGTPWYFTPHVN